MELVEVRRGLRVIFVYAIVLLAALLLTALSTAFAGHVTVHSSGGEDARSFLSVSLLFGGAAFAAFVIATCVAPGLSAESKTLPITWTRPVSRTTIAWRFIAVDLMAIVAGYALMLFVVAVYFGMFEKFGVLQYDWAAVPGMLLHVAGCTLMWYALIVLVASRFPGRGGMIAGLSWVAFMVVGGLFHAPFPPLLHDVLLALNFLNPLAYFGGQGDGGHASEALAGLSTTARTVIPWCIGIVALFGTVRLWTTQEH